MKRMSEYKKVTITRKNHNHALQTSQRHREEEPNNQEFQ